MALRSIPPRTACKRDDKKRKPRIIGADPVRFRTGRSIIKDRDSFDTWKPSIQTPNKKSLKKGFISEPPKYPHRPIEEIFENKKTYQITIEMPHHQKNEIKVEIKNDILIVESAKVDFNYCEEILLPSDILPESYEQSFNNGILAISFKKQQIKRTSQNDYLSFFNILLPQTQN